MQRGKATEESPPVFAAPILRLDLCADAYGDAGATGGRCEYLRGAGMLCGGQVQVPACRCVEVGVPELREIAAETCSFRFKGLLGLLPTVFCISSVMGTPMRR